MTLPRTLALKECLEAWQTVLDQTPLSIYLLPELAVIVAAYSVDVNKTVLERHCMIKLMELKILDQIKFRELCYHHANFKTSKDPYVVGCSEDIRQAFDWLSWADKNLNQSCILNQCIQTACCCEQPFTTKYLLSCFQNGDYYCY